MLQMMPTYTLERLQETDIDLLLPLYHWYCKEVGGEKEKAPFGERSDVVYRDGKPYKRVKAKDAKWTSNIF